MSSFVSRRRLLCGSAIAVASTLSIAAPAQAECVITAGAVTCGTTATTNTTNTGTTPASDREYVLDTTAGSATGTVSTGAAVTGNGLAFTAAPAGGANTLTVTNNGSVAVDAAAAPTVGGTAALNVTGTGATSIVYGGTGSITNNSLVGNADGLFLETTGTGNITATVGGNVTTVAPGSIAIVGVNNGTAGNVSLTTATGTTVRGGLGGITGEINNTANAGTLTIVNNGTILSPTDAPNTLQVGITAVTEGTGAVSVTNNGAIGSTTDRAGFGITASNNNTASSAGVSVLGSGTVFANDTGIRADTLGTGTVSVTTGAGAINAVGTTAGSGIGISTGATTGATTVTVGAGGIVAGGTGVETSSTTGAQTINVAGQITTNAGGLNGVIATSDTGTLAVNVQAGGGISAVDGDAISLDSDGAKTVNIAAGRTVTGSNGVFTTGAGTTAIVNAGTLTGTDAAVFAGALTDGAVTITNQTGATLNGRVSLTDQNDTLTNAGTFNASGAMDFFAGTDTLANQAGGTINVAAGTTFNGLETVNNAGTIVAASGLTFDAGNTVFTNTGTLNVTGAIDLGGGTDTFANSGAGVLTLGGNSSLVGVETFTNSGRINLNNFTLTGAGAFNNTGTLDTSGNASLAGFTTFSNAGTLDLAAGTFTVPAAVFTNTGTILADEGATTITGQTSFANSGAIDLQDGATGDVLTINSAFVGSGASSLLVDVDATTADRLVINGAASGSTTVNANYLGTGLINLDGVLIVDATSASAGAFTLGTVGGNVSPLVDYSLVQNGGDFLLVSTPNVAAFDPLVVPTFGRTLWYQSADEVISQTRLPAITVGASFWGQLYLSRDKYDDDSVQSIDGTDFAIERNLRTKRHGAQIGADYGFGGGRIGVTAGLARAKTDDRADVSDLELKARGWNIGVYGQFGGATGLHGEFLAKHDRYKLDFNSGAFDGEDTKARANGIDGSVGYRFGIGGDATLDANAGVSFVRTKFDDIDTFGFAYDLGTVKSTRGRAGLRATFGGSMSPYIDGTVYREFRGDGRVALFDGANTFDLETEGKATWFRVEGGVLPNPTGLMLAAWADLGDRKGLGARLGFRFGGAPVETVAPAPLPPAPAPVAPPPATQTCADGTVILATDSCPLPPPPPPPPPPAPERG